MDSRKLTRLSLRLFIASIVATALVGIVAITVPTGAFFEFYILLTTAIIAAASICGLACGGCMTRGHRILPGCGLALTVASAALLLAGIWIGIDSELFWKTAAIVTILAIACAHLSLLFMATLAGRFRWAHLAAYQLILGLAALLAGGIVLDAFDNHAFWQITGVLSILVAAITLLIPVFHRLSHNEVAARRAESDPLFAVDEEIARLKKQLLELENKRRMLLGRAVVVTDAPEI